MSHRLGPMQTLPAPMRKFAEGETVDYCIVGVGSAGGVVAQRLARAGFRVVALEAGPFWDTEKDWVSDEKGSHELYWNDLRITGGTHPLALGANNSGKPATPIVQIFLASGSAATTPTRAAVQLCMDMALRHERSAGCRIKADIRAELVCGIADCAMTCVPASGRRDREIAAAGAAGIGRGCAPVKLLQRDC